MSTNESADLERFATTDDAQTETQRPGDCACEDLGALVCWPCYRDGFETINPETEAAGE